MVVTATDNPIVLECTPPDYGPWASCAIELCPAPEPTKRRALRGEGGCTPIKASCAFEPVSGKARCDLTGKVEQVKEYAVVATAYKADGRSSKTGPQAPYTLPLYPCVWLPGCAWPCAAAALSVRGAATKQARLPHSTPSTPVQPASHTHLPCAASPPSP